MRLTRDEIRACKAEALKRVRIPQHVIQLVTDLRSYLQARPRCSRLTPALC